MIWKVDSSRRPTPTAHRPAAAEGDRAMVVATTGAVAVRAATQAMRDGASAVDAALMTALGQTALAAGSWVSYAGTMNLMYFEAATTRIHSLNAAFNTVSGEDDPLSIPPPGKASGRTALVPGFMAGVQAAHDRFGSIRFEKLFEPAIEYAEEGFVVDPVMARYLGHRLKHITRLPEGQAIFLKPDGRPHACGDRLRQPQLARTLRRLAAEGAAYFYQGEWASKFVATVSQHGGKMRRADLEQYRVIWTEPIRTVYGEYQVFGPGLPGLGGLHTTEALNLWDCASLSQRGHFADRPESLYWLMQITHVPYVGPYRSFEQRTTRPTAHRLWDEMRRQGGLTLFDSFAIQTRLNHSDGVVAADEAGNVAALCHSIHTIAWGTSGLFVDGVSVPDSACYQQREIKRAGAGKRLPDAMNPVIVLDDHAPVLASSCISYALHEETVLNLVSILDFGMTPQMALGTPRFLGPVWPGIFRLLSWRSKVAATLGRWMFWALASVVALFLPYSRKVWSLRQGVEAGVWPEPVLAGIRAMGQRLKVFDKDPPVAYWAGIQIDRRTGKLRGAATQRCGDIVPGVDSY